MRRPVDTTCKRSISKQIVLAVLVAALIVSAGCQSFLGVEPTSTTETPGQTSETSVPTRAITATSTPTPTPIDTSVKRSLAEFADTGEPYFEENSNLTNIDIRREEGTTNLSAIFNLPDDSPESREGGFEYALEVLVDSHYNFVVNGSSSYRPNYITVKTDYGTASASAELLQLYVDGKLSQETVAYIWAGKFDRYTALGDVDNETHATREERLAHTARIVEREMEANGTYVRNVETEIEDETLYVKYEHTDDSPNPSWPIEDTAVAYRRTVTKLGPDYMPTNGVRAYDYFPNGTSQATFFVHNRWIVSEYVGIRPIGESSLNGLNSIESMDGPHEGPP